MFYSPATAGSSAFSLYPAPDESPAINDVATLRSGKVTREGNVSSVAVAALSWQ